MSAKLRALVASAIPFIVAGGARRTVEKKLYDIKRTPEDYGAKGDGVADDSVPFQLAVVYCVNNAAELDLPGHYRLNSTINLAPGGVRDGLKISGRGRTRITTNNDGVLFLHCERVNIEGIIVEKLGVPGPGCAAFATPNNIQAASCTWLNVDVWNFRYAFAQRASIWNHWERVNTWNCLCGFLFARGDDMFNQVNPVASKIWNLEGGWFHNMNTFANVLCEGGEVGVWGALQGAVFNGLTTQGQRASAGGNKVLPLGEPGTGMWLQAGKATAIDIGWNNVINVFYAENTERPMRFDDQRAVQINTHFVQGGSQAAPFVCVIEANNSTVDLSGGTGQDYFVNKVKLSNGAKVYGYVGGNATQVVNGAIVEAVVDATSEYMPNGRIERFVKRYLIQKPNGSSGQKYVIPLEMPDQSIHEVELVALVDGYTHYRTTYKLSRWNTQANQTVFVDQVGGVAGPWAATADGRNLRLTFNDVLAVVVHVFVRKLSEIPARAVTLQPTP